VSSRSYGQNCGLARALDLLGERWTLLLLRELAMGPRRYKDLAARLPRIGTNLLAARLKSMEEAGLVERTFLDPPAPVSAYAVTDVGEELRPILGQLAAWGLRHGGAFDEADETRAVWLVLAMFSTSGSAAVTEFGGIVQIRVGDESAWAAPHGEGVQLREGVAPIRRSP
jgi:Predicted transcriptional regulators